MILMLEIRFHEFEVFCIEQRGKVAIVEGGLNFCLQIKVLPPHRFSTWRDLKYIIWNWTNSQGMVLQKTHEPLPIVYAFTLYSLYIFNYIYNYLYNIAFTCFYFVTSHKKKAAIPYWVIA
jgi:hypothetical protein